MSDDTRAIQAGIDDAFLHGHRRSWYAGRDFWWRLRFWFWGRAFTQPGIRWLITGELP